MKQKRIIELSRDLADLFSPKWILEVEITNYTSINIRDFKNSFSKELNSLYRFVRDKYKSLFYR